jgi:hypothetical protein
MTLEKEIWKRQNEAADEAAEKDPERLEKASAKTAR